MKTTTGGPIREIKQFNNVHSHEQVARAVLIIQRAVRRWKRAKRE